MRDQHPCQLRRQRLQQRHGDLGLPQPEEVLSVWQMPKGARASSFHSSQALLHLHGFHNVSLDICYSCNPSSKLVLVVLFIEDKID